MKKRIFAAILAVSLAVLLVAAVAMSLLSHIGANKLFPILLVGAVITAAILASAWCIAKGIVKPLEDPSAETYRELEPLMTRLRSQQAELVRKDDEFRTATDSMNEGLVLLGENGSVIVRPSGTEPKVKFYYTAVAATCEKSKALLDAMINQMS